MSVIYKGANEQLIIKPGETYTEAPNGLITLNREYSCATSYAATAIQGALTAGSAPTGYPDLKLFTKTRRDESGIATFSCVYTGHTGGSLITFSQAIRGFSFNGGISGRYISPTRTVQIARQAGTGGASTPSVFGSATVISITANGYVYEESFSLGTEYVELSSYDEQYFGGTEVATWTHSIATIYG